MEGNPSFGRDGKQIVLKTGHDITLTEESTCCWVGGKQLQVEIKSEDIRAERRRKSDSTPTTKK